MGIQKLGQLDPKQLTSARLELHWAAQMLQSAAAALVTPKADDSHTSLTWSKAIGGLETATLLAETTVGLRFSDLSLLVVQLGSAVSELALAGKSLSEAEAWLKQELVKRGCPASLELQRATYDMPEHPVSSGGIFGENKTAWAELANWYDTAAYALSELAAKTTGASAVKCWPHHFDVATLVVLSPGETEEDMKSVGCGFSPGDSSYSEPYYYVSPWPAPEAKPTPELQAGHWHTDEFYAAVLPSSVLVSFQSLSEQTQHLDKFLRSALTVALAQMRAAS